MAKSSFDILERRLNKLLKQLAQIDRIATGGTGGKGVMDGALGTTTNTGSMNWMSGIKTGITTAVGMASGMMKGMPDVQMTMARAGAYYQAGLASGNVVSNAAIQRNTRLGLGQFGMTSPGSSGTVSAYLATRGMMPNSVAYNQTVASVGNAARIMNMSNEVSMQAIEGLTNGQGSSNMLSKFGIFTSNLKTGQIKTQGQIFEQLAQRLTAGRGKTTVARTMDSLRRGNLGSTIRNSGLDEAQQAMFSQFMIERAKGNYMDLSDNKAMEKLSKESAAAGNENPFLSAYKLNAKEDRNMETAQQPYIDGIKAATEALGLLKDGINELIPVLGPLKAGLEVFAGDNTGQGFIQTAGAAALGAMAMGRGGKGDKASKGATPKAKGKPGFNLGKSVSKGLGKSAGWGLVASVAGSVIGDVVAGDSEQGSAQSKWGNAIGTAATWGGIGAMVGSVVIPGLGTGVGAAIGAAAGGIYGAFTGGSDSSIGLGSTKDTAGGGGTLGRPVASGEISAKFGQKGSVWSKGYHSGTDYAVPTGTNVYAAAAGKVSKSQKGSGSHSFGLYITIEHGGGLETLYGHLSQTIAKPGDYVTKGQLIAKSGQSGHVTGPHLHFEVYKNGVSVDPGTLSAAGLDTTQDTKGGSGGKGSNSRNGGNKKANKSQGILDTVLGGSGMSSSPISIGMSGVYGTEWTVGSMLTSSMAGGAVGMYSPATAAMSVGGSSSEIALGATSDVAGPASLTRHSASKAVRVGGGQAPQVNITVQVKKASEEEARRLAKMVKRYLEDDDLIERMGAK